MNKSDIDNAPILVDPRRLAHMERQIEQLYQLMKTASSLVAGIFVNWEQVEKDSKPYGTQ
jgi:hypothetical protein